jgi:hypothetical protein
LVERREAMDRDQQEPVNQSGSTVFNGKLQNLSHEFLNFRENPRDTAPAVGAGEETVLHGFVSPKTGEPSKLSDIVVVSIHPSLLLGTTRPSGLALQLLFQLNNCNAFGFKFNRTLYCRTC